MGVCRNCGDPSEQEFCGMCREMGANVIQFVPRPNPSRDQAASVVPDNRTGDTALDAGSCPQIVAGIDGMVFTDQDPA